MTLAFAREVRGPATHAFVVGCGHYPHLATAGSANRKSPVAGALAIVEHLVEAADILVAPLATIELLISDPAIESERQFLADRLERLDLNTVDPATAERFRIAGDRWLDRVREGDTVVFYFSGHGVVDRTGTAVGLLEDVKSQARRPWEATFGVQPLAQALGTIGAQSAWIFFDACQEISESISRDALNGSGIILKELTLEGLANESCEPLAIAGSKLGDMAYAPNDYRPPFFTQVLLKGLSGCCVTRTQAHGWAVTGEALLFNLKKLAAGLIENVEVKPQSLLRYSDEGVLSRAPAPFTSLKVRSLPESALKAAKSVRICLDDGKVIHSTQDPPYVWTVDVPLIEGNLLVDCVVAAGDAGLDSHTFRPEPPIHHIVLRARS